MCSNLLFEHLTTITPPPSKKPWSKSFSSSFFLNYTIWAYRLSLTGQQARRTVNGLRADLNLGLMAHGSPAKLSKLNQQPNKKNKSSMHINKNIFRFSYILIYYWFYMSGTNICARAARLKPPISGTTMIAWSKTAALLQN